MNQILSIQKPVPPTLRDKVLQIRELDRKIAHLMASLPTPQNLSIVLSTRKVEKYTYSSWTRSYIERPKASKEQSAVAKMWEMKLLLSETHYLFSHGLSGNIAIMHDLISLVDRADVAFPCRIPLYKKRFRLPCETAPYSSAEEFLRLSHQNDHEERQREILLSTDGYLFQDKFGESSLDFFKDNSSVCQKRENKPWNTFLENTFDKFFEHITASTTFTALMKKSVKEFMEKSQFAGMHTDWNHLNLIAIPKETLDDPDQNYAYRSHEWGISCDKARGQMDETYTNAQKLENQKVFSSMLETHNNLDPSFKLTDEVRSRFPKKVHKPVNPLPTSGRRIIFPPGFFPEDKPQPDSPVCCDKMIAQYRLMAHNLDNDKRARVLTFNKYSDDEKKQYLEEISPIVHLIKTAIRLESINEFTSSSQVESILLRLDLDGVLKGHTDHKGYLEGVMEILDRKSLHLEKHKEYLLQHLPAQHQALIFQ